jgi:hypothetical protein
VLIYSRYEWRAREVGKKRLAGYVGEFFLWPEEAQA